MIRGPETPLAVGAPDIPAMDPEASPIVDTQVEDTFSDVGPGVGLPDLIMNDGMGIPLDLIRQTTSTTEQLPNGADIQQTTVDTSMPDVPSGMGRGDQQRQSGGGGARVQVSAPRFGRELTQEDFYGRQKNFQWNDPRGAVMQMADAGRLPMSIATSRMRQNQTELATLRKQKQDLIKSWEVDAAPDPYQPSFQKLLTGMQGSFISGLADQYGGNEDLAWNEIMSNPKTMAEWESLHKEAEAVGKYGRFIWDESKAYLDRAATGKYHIDPEMQKMAEDVYNGFGNLKGTDGLPSMRQLLNSSEKFHRAISREEFVKNFSMPGLKERYQQWQEANISRNRATNTNVLELKKHYNAEKFLDETANSMTLAIPGTTLEENKKYLRNVIPPEKIETEVKMLGVPSGGGGSGSGNTGRGTNVRADFRPLDTNDGGKVVPGQNTLFFTPFQNTGDKEHTVKEIVVSSGVGAPSTPLRDATLVYRPGRRDWALVGQSLSEYGQTLLEEVEKDESLDEEERSTKKDQIWEKNRKQKVVPAASNSSILDTYWGSADPNAAAAKIAGVKPEEMDRLVKTESGRAEIARKMGLPVEGSKGKNSGTSAAPGYSIGQVDEGYKYIGGDPTSPDSWKSVSENPAKSPAKQATSPSPSPKNSPAKAAVTAKEQPAKEVLKQEQSPEEQPVIHTKKAVADTLLSQKKDGYEAMSERLDKNYEPGVYRYKNQQEADAELDAKKVVADANRVANDDDPKGFFKDGVMVESKIGNKKVFFIMDKSGMRPLSNYFDDKESARLVLDAFNRGEIREEFISRRSRGTTRAFEELLNKD